MHKDALSGKKVGFFRELYNARTLTWTLAKNDFKTRFAGSYLGIIWGFIQPLVTIAVYWFVFSYGLKMGSSDVGVPYILWLICGIIPWFFFSQSWSGATNCLGEYSYLVKKVVFPFTVLPMVKIISEFFVHLFFLAIMLILFAVYGMFPDLYYLQIFYYMLCTLVLTLGISMLSACVNVFFKDTSQIVAVALQLGFWVTPVIWNIKAMGFSPIIVNILKVNPMYYIVQGYREALIDKVWFWESPVSMAVFWAIALLLLLCGIKLFNRMKPHFSDVL